MASSLPYGQAEKLAKQVLRVLAATAGSLTHAELEDAGRKEAATIAAKSSGKGKKHTAKIEAERHAEYLAEVKRCKTLGLPEPAPYLTRAEEHHREQAIRQAANKAKMEALLASGHLRDPSSNSSSSTGYSQEELEKLMETDPSKFPEASTQHHVCKMMNKIRERAERDAARAAEVAYSTEYWRRHRALAPLRARFAIWANLFLRQPAKLFWRLQNLKDFPMSKIRLADSRRLLRLFDTGDCGALAPYRPKSAADEHLTNSLHLSGLPHFARADLSRVIGQIKAQIGTAAPEARDRTPFHLVENANVIMRGGKGLPVRKVMGREECLCSGFAFATVATPELASAIASWFTRRPMTITVNGYNTEKSVMEPMTATLKIVVARSERPKSAEEQQAIETKLRTTRQHAAYMEVLRLAAEKKELKKKNARVGKYVAPTVAAIASKAEWASLSAALATVDAAELIATRAAAARKLWEEQAEKRAAEAAVEGCVLLQVGPMLAAWNPVAPMTHVEIPKQENGWEWTEAITVAEARKRLADKATVEQAAAAVKKAAAEKAGKVAAASASKSLTKNPILRKFFGRA
jgi:hypothetical protein